MTLRIAVDATSLLDVRTGVGNFTAALLDGLARRDLDVTAFPVSLRGRERFADVVPAGIRAVAPPLPAVVFRSLWRRFDRPSLDRLIGSPDVVHGPNFVVPPSRTAARIATVHDLTCVRFPELCERDTLAYPDLIRRATAGGAWIHTPSEAVRTEVLAHFDVDPDRVVAVPNGFTPMAAGDAGRGRTLAGRDGYVLAVGTVEPRKGLPTLVEAIDRAAGDGTDIPLVHVGPDGWGSEALARSVAAMHRPDLFTQLGPRSGSELADLYRGARLFAYPSVYEGFGIPVLEAMSAGVPVVTTTDPAVEEVVGGAALLVPVGDVDALASALTTGWTDETRRETLVAAGHRRTEHYSWEACVDGLVGLYRRAGDAERL